MSKALPFKNRPVLFRAAHHSADLEIELARRRIPFVKYGGLRYLEAAHVKDLLAAFVSLTIHVTKWRGSASYNSFPEWARQGEARHRRTARQ